MSIFFLSCLLLLCMCMPSSATTTTTPFRQCFEALVNLTQRCDNHNFFYSTTMGFGQGFGSEFNMYFIKSMIRAVLSNRRYVYLDSKRPWEYNCAENSGWACYFSIPPCTDGVARSKDLDFSVRPSADKYESPGSVLFDREEMGDYIFRNNEFLNAMRKLSATKAYKDLLPSGVCSGLPDDTVFYASDLGGPSAQRLFHFNNRTTIGVQGINARYEHLSRKPYASMFMRLTDKQGEMPEEDWALISNTTFVAYRFLEVLHNHTVKHGLKPGHLRDIYMGMFYQCLLFVYICLI